MWDLSCPTRDQIHTACIGRQSLNYCTRKSQNTCSLSYIKIQKEMEKKTQNKYDIVSTI